MSVDSSASTVDDYGNPINEFGELIDHTTILLFSEYKSPTALQLREALEALHLEVRSMKKMMVRMRRKRVIGTVIRPMRKRRIIVLLLLQRQR